MASNNVFGKPVTDETVRSYNPKQRTPITARDRAQLALVCMTAGGKATQVSRFVKNLGTQVNGDDTSTLGMIYNATGSDLTFVVGHTWEGREIGHKYPLLIQNGQWAGFVHASETRNSPSKAAVVYRGTINEIQRDLMLAWDTTTTVSPNHLYTDIRRSDAFNGGRVWDTINAEMEKQEGLDYSRTNLGFYSAVSTGVGSSPEFVGVMSLDLLAVDSFGRINDDAEDVDAATPPAAAE